MLTAFWLYSVSNTCNFPLALLSLPLTKPTLLFVGLTKFPALTRDELLQKRQLAIRSLQRVQRELSEIIGAELTSNVATEASSAELTSQNEESSNLATSMGGASVGGASVGGERKALGDGMDKSGGGGGDNGEGTWSIAVLTACCALFHQWSTYPVQLIRAHFLVFNDGESVITVWSFVKRFIQLGLKGAYLGAIWWLPLDIIASFRLAFCSWPLYEWALRGDGKSSRITRLGKFLFAFCMELLLFLPISPLYLRYHLEMLHMRVPSFKLQLLSPKVVLILFVYHAVFEHISHWVFLKTTYYLQRYYQFMGRWKRRKGGAHRRRGLGKLKRESSLDRGLAWVIAGTLTRSLVDFFFQRPLGRILVKEGFSSSSYSGGVPTIGGFSMVHWSKILAIITCGAAIELLVGCLVVETMTFGIDFFKYLKKKRLDPLTPPPSSSSSGATVAVLERGGGGGGGVEGGVASD